MSRCDAPDDRGEKGVEPEFAKEVESEVEDEDHPRAPADTGEAPVVVAPLDAGGPHAVSPEFRPFEEVPLRELTEASDPAGRVEVRPDVRRLVSFGLLAVVGGSLLFLLGVNVGQQMGRARAGGAGGAGAGDGPVASPSPSAPVPSAPAAGVPARPAAGPGKGEALGPLARPLPATPGTAAEGDDRSPGSRMVAAPGAPPSAPGTRPVSAAPDAPLAPAARAAPSAQSPPAPARPGPPSMRFTVQVGAYQDEAEAMKTLRILRANGHNPYIQAADLDGRGRWFRVRVGRFDSREAAQAFARGLRRLADMDPFVAPM